MKLKESVSWLMGTLQGRLFAALEECYKKPLTDHEKQLVKILEIAKVDSHVPKSTENQWLGRKLKERDRNRCLQPVVFIQLTTGQ